MPKVTILMTSYNHEKYIRESIESVLGQTFKDFELIIVDDCSTDKSFEIIKSFKDKRIRAIRNEKNKGPEYAFEILHKTAKGKLIAIADSDNVWEKDKLKKQVEFLDKNSKYAAVFTRVKMIDEDGKPFEDKKSVYYGVFDAENRSRQEWLRHFFYHGNCLCHPSVVIRKETYKKCGMIVDGLWQVPDFYKWIRLCLKDEFYILDEKLIRFRLHKNNISGEYNLGNILRGSNEVYQVYKLFYEISEKDFPLVFEEAAAKYTVDEKISIKFAVSRMLLELGIPAVRTLALNKLFEILNDKKEREQVFELYGYDDVSYKNDETKYAPFVLTSAPVIYKAKLYCNFGDGFNERDIVEGNFIADAEGNFNVKFEDINEGNKLVGLRFDPCESCVKVKIEKVVSQDGKKLTFRAIKENYSTDQYERCGDYDYFYMNDPMYLIEGYKKDLHDLSVCGKIEVLSVEEIVKMKNAQIGEMEKKMINVGGVKKFMRRGFSRGKAGILYLARTIRKK